MFLKFLERKGIPFEWRSDPNLYLIKNNYDHFLMIDKLKLINLPCFINSSDEYFQGFIRTLSNNSLISDLFYRVFYNDYEIIYSDINNSGIITGINNLILCNNFINNFDCYEIDYEKINDCLIKENNIDLLYDDLINNEFYLNKDKSFFLQTTDYKGYIEEFLIDNVFIKYKWCFCNLSDGILRRQHWVSKFIICNKPKISQIDLSTVLSFYDFHIDHDKINEWIEIYND